MPVRLAVLASGGGSNLQALLNAHDRGDLPASIVLVVSNNSGSHALNRAQEHGIAHRHISARTDSDPCTTMLAAFEEHRIDVIALAGYLKHIDPRVLKAFPGRVVNIHPGPLPRFGGKGMYGRHVHEAVLSAGVAISGPSVFVVTDGFDEGPLLAHREVPVLGDDDCDSLASRVLEAEHDLYWRVIRRHFCEA